MVSSDSANDLVVVAIIEHATFVSSANSSEIIPLIGMRTYYLIENINLAQ